MLSSLVLFFSIWDIYFFSYMVSIEMWDVNIWVLFMLYFFFCLNYNWLCMIGKYGNDIWKFLNFYKLILRYG